MNVIVQAQTDSGCTWPATCQYHEILCVHVFYVLEINLSSLQRTVYYIIKNGSLVSESQTLRWNPASKSKHFSSNPSHKSSAAQAFRYTRSISFQNDQQVGSLSSHTLQFHYPSPSPHIVTSALGDGLRDAHFLIFSRFRSPENVNCKNE